MEVNSQPVASDAMAPAAEGMDDLFGVSIPQLQVQPQEVVQPSTTIAQAASEASPQVAPVVATPPVQESVTPPTVPAQPPVQGVVVTQPIAPVVPTPVVDPQLAALQQQNAMLQQMLTTLHGQIQSQQAVQPQGPGPLDKLLAEADMDSVLENKENFTKFLQTFATVVMDNAQQGVTQRIPTMLEQHTTLQQLRNDFYGRHKELAGVKDYVAQVAANIAKAMPTADPAQVLELAAVQAKQALGLPLAPIQQPTAPMPLGHQGPVVVAPTLPGGTGNRQPAPPSGVADAIEELRFI